MFTINTFISVSIKVIYICSTENLNQVRKLQSHKCIECYIIPFGLAHYYYYLCGTNIMLMIKEPKKKMQP